MIFDDDLHDLTEKPKAQRLRRSTFKYLEEKARMQEDSELQDLLLNARQGDTDAARELVERYPRLSMDANSDS